MKEASYPREDFVKEMIEALMTGVNRFPHCRLTAIDSAAVRANIIPAVKTGRVFCRPHAPCP
jgi:hypothetical protein